MGLISEHTSLDEMFEMCVDRSWDDNGYMTIKRKEGSMMKTQQRLSSISDQYCETCEMLRKLLQATQKELAETKKKLHNIETELTRQETRP